MSKGNYATIVSKYMLHLKKRNRLSDKYYDLLLDWYGTYEENTYGKQS